MTQDEMTREEYELALASEFDRLAHGLRLDRIALIGHATKRMPDGTLWTYPIGTPEDEQR